MKRYSTITILVLFLAASLAVAGERTHQIEAEDYFSIAGMTGIALSPDGTTAAWTESRWSKEDDGRQTELWSMDLERREPKRLTFEGMGPSGIRFSRDGRSIYFSASDGDGNSQIWRIESAGGNPKKLTSVSDGIELWDLSADENVLVYTISTDQTDDEWKDLRDTYSDLEYGHGVTSFSEVHSLDLKTWRTRTVFDGKKVIRSLDLSADGTLAALATTQDNELVHNEGWSSVEVLDIASGEITLVTTDGWRSSHDSPFGWIDGVAMADDGKALAFTVGFDGFPTLVYTAKPGNTAWAISEQKRPQDVSIAGGSIGWKPGSHILIYNGDSHARVRLFGQAIGGTGNILTSGDTVIGGHAFNADGSTLLVSSGALDSPQDLYLVDSDGILERVSRINPQIDDWILPSIEIVKWTAPDGAQVEGILELPPGWTKADGPLPLIVEIHGGPTAATHLQLRFWIYGRTLLPAKGYALLSPNYRGSTGYGDQFMTQLVGHENDIEVKDILAGVDAMIERGIADPDRLGVMGWSNGGFLTNALIAATTRFKAASSGAGTLDQVLQWAVEDTPGHVINFMGAALPWQNPEHYVKGSPLYGLASVTTPTLIHVGGNDPRVPPAHSRGLYRALKIYLDVPTELVVYPGAAHGLRTYTHRKAKMAWDLAWFEKYLGVGWGQEVAE
ncbi:MAG: S9 family peptidase [Acidobacteria bacterium]|nr:MAG: S9 family peptidase [Acidobacteriota bacterium]RLE32265.1 MAG: S9 family peptidase [Acidobacteriota bacterium]